MLNREVGYLAIGMAGSVEGLRPILRVEKLSG